MRHIGLNLRVSFLLLFLVGAYFMLSRVEFDNSISRWMPEDSKAIQDYKVFLQDFNSDALFILAFKKNDSVKPGKDIIPGLKLLQKNEAIISINKWPVSNIKYKKESPPGDIVYLIRFEPKSFINPNRPELIEAIHKIFTPTGLTYYLAGTGVIHHAINQQTKSDTSAFLLSGLLVLLIILIIILRSFIAILQTLLVALAGVATIIYIAALFSIPIGIAHTIVPVIILFYSTSVSMHLLSHKGDFRKVLIPSLWVVITTSLGFSAFLFSSTPLLNDFAILGLSGLFGVFLSAIWIFYPQAYIYKPRSFFNRASKFNLIPFRIVLIAVIGVILIGLPGLLKLNAEIYSLSVLSEKDRAYVDHTHIESEIGAYFPLEYTVDENNLKRTAIIDWIEEVYRLKEIGAVISYHQIPSYLNRKNIGFQSKSNEKLFRISYLVPLMSTTKGLSLVSKIDSISRVHFINTTPEITGFMTLYSSVSDELLDSFKYSLIWAFSLILVVMIIFLKRWKLILLAMLVNTLPVLSMLGLMGWLGIRLDMVTIPIGCLLLGIVVDDSIHFMHWFKKTGNWRMTLENAGAGILITSLVLSAGFSILIFSEAPPVQYFGLLSLFAVLAALVCDLFLLPSFIQKFLTHEN